MSKAIGYSKTVPLIKEVSFPARKIVLHLYDGRIINLPIEKFPAIAKLTSAQKRKYKTLAGMGLMFDDCDTVFHISDFLGQTFPIEAQPPFKNKVKDNISEKVTVNQVAEPKVKYKKG